MWRRIGKAMLVAIGLFIFWLFAVWPPPLWYRVTFPRRDRLPGDASAREPGGRPSAGATPRCE
ncbi:MAG: hypothetical protein V9E87_17150 [Gemmatimonadales bacterium]